AIVSGDSLKIQEGAKQIITASNFSNAGSVSVSANSSLTVAAGYTQTAGATIVDGLLKATGPIQITGGIFGGAGIVQGDLANAAQLGADGSSGILTITGNYTQTAAGTLNVKIGGTAVGTQYDQLNVLGSANLDGALNISLINGFGPRF